MKSTFMKCPQCEVKTGSSSLCPSCLHNRAVIEGLHEARRQEPICALKSTMPGTYPPCPRGDWVAPRPEGSGE